MQLLSITELSIQLKFTVMQMSMNVIQNRRYRTVMKTLIARTQMVATNAYARQAIKAVGYCV